MTDVVDDPRKSAVFDLGPGLVRVRAPNPSAMTGTGTNSYLVGTTDLVAIDPGPNDPGHLRLLFELAGDRLRYVLVTHHHSDHAPGARPLAEMAAVPLLAYGFGEEFVPDCELRDGDLIAVPGFQIEAVHTPGHSSDHLCFIADREDALLSERYCFSGDHIMGGSSVGIFPTDGSMLAYIESLDRLIALDRSITTIAPGHGEAIADPRRALSNCMENRRTRERYVLEALSEVSTSPAEIVPLAYRGLGARFASAAAMTVWAHLRKFGEEGTAVSDDPDLLEGRWRLVTAAEE
jgi:glyoxylase-like metal-dependent hydrolase (beta-lactamase superfamily II)